MPWFGLLADLGPVMAAPATVQPAMSNLSNTWHCLYRYFSGSALADKEVRANYVAANDTRDVYPW
jgi:hypothetical protein